MIMQWLLQSPIPENGLHYIRGQSHQEEVVHQIVQEEVQEQEWEITLIQATIHPKEEDGQGPMGQEEHSPQEEAIQEAIQAVAAHHQALHHHSSQEEQVIQVVHRRARLQAYLIQEPFDHSLRSDEWTA